MANKNSSGNSSVIKYLGGAVLFFGVIIVITVSVNLSSEYCHLNSRNNRATLPLVINTWAFTNATEKAWSIIRDSSDVLEAVEEGCSECERLQCDGTVGYGGSPDENGETTLDAMIMDGDRHDVGAVAGLRGIKDAISVAKHVLLYTEHTLLVGDLATDFAVNMGFLKESLSTDESREMHQSWKAKNCQPNFWRGVDPDPRASCGPYKPNPDLPRPTVPPTSSSVVFDENNHDTIGMIVIDESGRIAGGTSTNGARNKIPGRVGDSPIPGSGCYVDRKVGGAAATGDGDVMMRMLPSLIAVEGMREGLIPADAALKALKRVVEYYPKFEGAIVAATIEGSFGGACYGFSSFKYSVAHKETDKVEVKEIQCFTE